MQKCSKGKECPISYLPYAVREGDSLFSIAALYGTKVQLIIDANVNLNPYNLNVGQVICVPLLKEEYPSCRTTNYYIAQEGDTFFSIAAKFGVDINELLAANSGVEPENIYDGIILCIPIAPPKMCVNVPSGGESINIIFDDRQESYNSRWSGDGILKPQKYIMTQKRLDSGAVDGAKELLFSPLELGIRGQRKMDSSNATFLEVSDEDMLKIFNTLPVGVHLEVTP